MKKNLTNYVFDASAKTITLTDFTNINKDELLGIDNATKGITIYEVGNGLKDLTISGNVLTLVYDTTQMADTDVLNIGYNYLKPYTFIDDFEDVAIITGPNTGVKGLRVYPGPTDLVSDIPVGIDLAHHQIHEGEMHQYTYPPTALASGSSLDFRIVVPVLDPKNNKTPNFVLEVDATAETWVYLYEAPTITGNGTQQTVYNRNRNSAIVPGTTIWLAPTNSALGNMLNSFIIGSGVGAGGGAREAVEWDLKSNTTYLVRITAKAASDDICARFMWYEDLGV